MIEVDPTITAAIICSDEYKDNKVLIPNMLVISFSDTTDRNFVNAITSEQAKDYILIDILVVNIEEWEETDGIGIMHKNPEVSLFQLNALQ